MTTAKSESAKESTTAPVLETSEDAVAEATVSENKKKFTKNTKSAQQASLDMSKAGKKMTKAVSKGISAYMDRHEKSSRKRKDGAVLDSFVNFSRGFSEGISAGAPAFSDMSKAFDRTWNSKKNRKQMKKQMKRMRKMAPVPFMR